MHWFSLGGANKESENSTPESCKYSENLSNDRIDFDTCILTPVKPEEEVEEEEEMIEEK